MSESIPSLPSTYSLLENEIKARRSVMDSILSNLNDLKNSIGNRGEAFVLFEKNLLFLKGFGIFFLVTMSIINWYMNHKSYGFVSNHPTKFALESGVFGLCGVLPFLLLVFLRNEEMSTKKVIFFAVTIFVLFFGLNYALEISGFYSVVFKYNKDEKPEEDIKKTDYRGQFKRSFSYTSDLFMTLSFLLAFICLFFSSLIVRDYHPKYIRLQNVPTFIVFIMEMLLFGAISAIPIYLISHNRNRLDPKHTSIEFALITLKFALVHCILQLSGFYTYTFKGKIPE